MLPLDAHPGLSHHELHVISVLLPPPLLLLTIIIIIIIIIIIVAVDVAVQI